MAKKSNKTEQVLKLITKDEEVIEALVEPEAASDDKKDPVEDVKEPIILTAQSKAEDSFTEIEKPKPDPVSVSKKEQLVNLSEILVRERMELVMGKMNVCSCHSCVNDILALALNALPTKYVTTDEGKQYTQLEIYKKQYETDVLAALTKACVRVKAAPRH